MNLQFLRYFLLVLVCSGLFVGHISFAAGESSETHEQSVKERFQSRWSALVEREFEVAYQYESPEYREKTDLKSYVDGFSNDLTWKSVNFEKIGFEGESQAVIAYTMDFVFKKWGVEFADTARHDEEWFLQDGEWWHNRKPPSLSSGKSK